MGLIRTLTRPLFVVPERLGNLYDVYFADRSQREVRLTAIGFKPDDSYIEDKGVTPSGNREYYKVIRKGRK